MTCQRCQSNRLISVSAKCSDCCTVDFLPSEADASFGYVPSDLGIGGGDYLRFKLCLNCGQMWGTWPLPAAEIERICNFCWNEPGVATWERDGQQLPIGDECWAELQND